MLFSPLLKCAERLFHLTFLAAIIMYLLFQYSCHTYSKLCIPLVLKDSLLQISISCGLTYFKLDNFKVNAIRLSVFEQKI